MRMVCFASVLIYMVNHASIYIQRERNKEREQGIGCIYWEYMLSLTTGQTWGCEDAAALPLLSYQTWPFLEDPPLGSEIIR